MERLRRPESFLQTQPARSGQEMPVTQNWKLAAAMAAGLCLLRSAAAQC